MGEVALAVLTLGAWVFAASAGSKLRHRRAYRAFLTGLRETRLVPQRALPAMAALLAGAEAAIAVSLATLALVNAVAGERTLPVAEAALGIAAVLTIVLAAGVAVVTHRGTRAPCACFGARPGRPLGRAHLVRNLVLLAAIVTGLIAGPFAAGPGSPAAAALAAGVGTLAALVIIHWEDLAGLFGPGPAAGPSAPAQPAPVSRRVPG